MSAYDELSRHLATLEKLLRDLPADDPDVPHLERRAADLRARLYEALL